VNRHAIEVFLVDSAGVIVATWARRRWDPAEIVGRAAGLAARAEGDT
jgi:cytochrome oxidase Cu insertion factor (SCO1/SenC/PrrC family)